MSLSTFTRGLAALLLLAQLASSQFIQEWWFQVNQFGEQETWWRPTQNDPPRRVWDMDPYIVYLEYNCFYMTAICQNANNYLISAHGSSRTPRKAFAYDFTKARADKRRRRVCPTGTTSGWGSFHTCPELSGPGNLAQPPVYRSDGLPWFTTALEPNVPARSGKILMHKRFSTGRLQEYSGVKYTCDEFPPATFIQGGAGLGAEAYAAETRCAGFRCPKNMGGKDSEQNWQANGHNKLRSVLEDTAEKCLAAWTPADEPLMFFFRMRNEEDGIPVRVIEADAGGDEEIKNWVELTKRSGIENIKEMKKRSMREFMEWADTVPLHKLTDHGFNLKTHHIFKNQSSSPAETMDDGWGDFGQWNSTDDEQCAPSQDPVSNNWKFEPRTDIRLDNQHEHRHHMHKRHGKGPYKRASVDNSTSTQGIDTSSKNFTSADIAAATKIVEEAMNKSAEYNKARWENMSRNQYRLKPGTIVGGKADVPTSSIQKRSDVPNFVITPEIEAAAALLTEFEASGMSINNQTERGRNSTTGRMRISAAAAAGSFWMEAIGRKGTVPWGNDASYKVFRNVKDYGAKGDGKTDDTAAIKKAMDDGKRCGKNCNGSTTKNAIVYFPAGTYLVSSVIPVYFGTQLVGDANNWPTIMASSRFIGTAVLSTDEYTGGGIGIDGGDQEWYVNTASFYRQIRNFKVDVTATRSAQEVACVHYQVGQATSLQYVELIAKSGTKQRGIVAENGSGGVLADIKFKGGAYGLWGGSQQFTAQRLTFDGCATAVQIIWDWAWTWKSITVKNADIGFRLLPEDKKPTTNPTNPSKENGNIGSAYFLDSTFENVGSAVVVAPLNSAIGSGSTGLVLENIAMNNVQKAVADSSGNTILASTGKIDQWVAGPTYSPKREFSMGKSTTYKRQSSLLDSNGAYFERAKPQYEDRSAGDFVHIKDFGAKGDGVTDDTSAVQSALNAAVGRILHVDAGTYILTRTVTVPSGSKIVGETWSQLAASGSFFGDANNPKVMLQVGAPGQTGDVEMQDLMFTTKGATPGAILVQWNMKASKPGSAGIWDCHARIGGASGTSLNPEECPPITNGVNPNCQGASLMMHITPKSSGYFENMWLWVADHMIDDPDLVDANNTMVQTSVYVARGLLVESQEPTWMYGTASEHAVFYQYNFNKAKNIFAGMIQTESPYYQPTPKAPAPFEKNVGKFPGDPKYKCDGKDFDGCDSSWAVIIRESSDIVIGGAGLYSWFSTYAQDCIDGQTCQKALLWLENNGANVRIQHLITIGAKYSLVQDGRGVAAKDNLNVEGHPRWSQISIFESSKNEIYWIDPKIWDMDEPTVWCEPPCQLKLPPWEKSTSTIDYPIITATGQGWTTMITKAPLTISQWVMEPLTIGDGVAAAAVVTAKARRDDVITSVKPKFTSTPVWPALVYMGGDGKGSTTRPATPTHPGPPEWPAKALLVKKGAPSPLVAQCSFKDPDCLGGWDNWIYGPMGHAPDDGSFEETLEDDGLPCPSPSEGGEEPTPTPTVKPKPPTVEFDVPDPSKNTRKCYHAGQWTSHSRIKDAANHLCGLIKNKGRMGPGEKVMQRWSYNYDPNELGSIGIETSFEVKAGCEFKYTDAACDRYVNVPIDSCNCAGINGKQGGEVENNCYKWRIDPEKES